MKIKTFLCFSVSLLILLFVCTGCQIGREAPPNNGSSQKEPDSPGSNTDIDINDDTDVSADGSIIGTWVAYGYWATEDDGGDGEIHEFDDSDKEANYKFVFDEAGTFEFTIADGTITHGTYWKTKYEDWEEFNYSQEYYDTWLSSGYSLFYDKRYDVYYGYLEGWDFVDYIEERQEIEWAVGDTAIVFKKAAM